MRLGIAKQGGAKPRAWPWFILCAALLLLGIAGCIWAWQPASTGTVEVLQDGAVLYRFNLNEIPEERLIEVPYGEHRNLLQIKDHSIRVLEADCPDQTCVRMGALRSSAMPIVCLPHRLVIRFVEDGELDAVAQ